MLEQVHDKLPIAGVLGLTRRQATDAISGYVYSGDFCEQHDIPFYGLQDYGLRNDADRQACLDLDIDVLAVVGWQRLIPDWLIKHCGLGALGVHGSAYGITGGRGRSPQNWAILLGREDFHLSLFKIDAGIDSGEIVDTESFAITGDDDIRTSYLKVAWLTARMLQRALADGDRPPPSRKQGSTDVAYLPQRRPGDGAIDWRRTTAEIHDFVRALTRPYPGAFSECGGQQVRIWRTRPLGLETDDTRGADDTQGPGFIVTRFPAGDLIVRTGDGVILVEEYELEEEATTTLGPGDCLESADFQRQIQAIVERHQEKHPDLPIAADILELLI